MKSFPVIKREKLSSVFDSIKKIYNQDLVKLLEAANQSFAHDSPIQIGADSIENQLQVVKNRIRQVGDGIGQKLFIQLIEKLYENLENHGAVGVTKEMFCSCIIVCLKGGNQLLFENGKWSLKWNVLIPNDDLDISLLIRDKEITEEDIVPNYIIEYIDQSILAFQNNKNLTALSLISIALEGTLRDVLEVKGYTYTNGAPTVDVFNFMEAEISRSANGYNVRFINQMPKDHSVFLSEADIANPHIVKVRRLLKRDDWRLEIKGADYLKDYWSSDQIIQNGQADIRGLGTALNIARDENEANILEAHILPTDLDDVIKKVRNHLIHLSGNAITTEIPSISQTLEEFAKNESRVFDTINSICEAIQVLYLKKARNIL